MERYLKILDRPEIQSKSQFVLACAVEGLEVDDKKYSEILDYEISQLKNIEKISHMFDSFPEKSLFEYKKHFHLVNKAEMCKDASSLSKTFHVEVVGLEDPDKDSKKLVGFNYSMDLMEDMQAMHGIDVSSEMWSLISHECLKR